MKKILCLLLCISILLGCGITNVFADAILTPEEILAPFDTTPAPALTIPDGKYPVFEYDCTRNGSTTIVTGSESGFTKYSTSEYIKPDVLGGEKIIRATNLKDVAKTPRIEKKVALGTKPGVLTYAFYAQLGEGNIFFQLASANGKIISATKPATASAKNVWDLVCVEFNFKKNIMSLTVNGKSADTDALTLSDEMDLSEVTVSLYYGIDPLETIVTDNFVMYLDKEPDFSDQKYYGTAGTTWELVGEPVNADSYVSNLKTHPRLFIRERSDVTNKIASSEECALWYSHIKSNADSLLVTENLKYEMKPGERYITNIARAIKGRLINLAFTYMVEKDKKYVERGLSEIRNAGTYPDWSNNAPMVPAELMFGVAFFYDWAYDALTPDERKEIVDILKKQALWQFARSYDGVITVEIAHGVSNRSLLANASAACTAIAIADEEPVLAEFLFKNAILHTKKCVEEYGTDGAFPEGASYWGLATEYMLCLTAGMETAFRTIYRKPAELEWYYNNEIIKNTGDYWMYTAGPKYAFDFGDADKDIFTKPMPYWLSKKYGNPAYTWQMNDLVFNKGNGTITYPHFAILFYDTNTVGNIENMPLDKTFDAKDNAQLASMRSSWTDDNALFVSMQGGDNQTGHMFKSLGTFVLDANGKRFIRTPGRSDYNSAYDKKLYYPYRAEGQNTIIANPTEDWDQNPTAIAKFISHEEAENEAFAILDMTQTNTVFTDAKRGMYMTKGRRSVVLQDEIKTSEPSELWWTVHTDGDIILSADKKSAMITLEGERLSATITQGPANAIFEIRKAEPIDPNRATAPDAIAQNYYKLVIHVSNATELNLSVEFVPLKDGEAAPETLTPVLPMAEWSVSDNTITTARQAGDAVALLLNSPVVLDKGNRTYVDKANMDVYPFTENGRTLVPVRFISESFDAKVGWDEKTQTVTVTKNQKKITLQIGSNKLYVNGEERILDVPATTYNGRTLIPLRALVEALGKQVLWDDRGLIVISDHGVEYTNEEKTNIISLLSERVLLNGEEMQSFTTDKTEYTILADDAVPTVTLTSGASVTQNGNIASFVLGDKTYTITFVSDKFAGQFGTNSEGNIKNILLSVPTLPTPTEPTWHPVKHVTFSVGHDKYVEFGTVDNIISDELVNRWSGMMPSWICYEFEEPTALYAFGLAGMHSDNKPRGFIFNAEVSMDGENWEKVLDTQTSGTTLLPDIFLLNGKQAKFFRINGRGDTQGGNYNSYGEVRFYTSEEQLTLDQQYWPTYFANVAGAYGKPGDTIQLTMTAVNGKNEQMDATGVVLTSNNPEIATIDENGLITMVSAGYTMITATYEGLFQKITSTIPVNCVQ